MSLSLPIPVAAVKGAAQLEAAPPTFTHYFMDADKFKVTPNADYQRHKGPDGKALNIGISDPRLEISGSLMIKAASQLLKIGDVIKPIDATGSPWYNIYFTVTKADAGSFILGQPVMQDVTMEYNPGVDLSGATNVDA